MEALEKLKPLALLLLRLGIGIIFIHHGYPKLFGSTRATVQMFTHLGFPAFAAYLVGVVELFGGILLIAGLFTRIAGLLIAGEMAVALWKVHHILSEPLAVQTYEFPLACAVGAFTLACLGAGAISLDHAIFGHSQKPSRAAKNRR